MADSVEFMLPGETRDSGSKRVFRYVTERMQEFAETIHDPALEAVVPDVAVPGEPFVEAQSKHRQDPLHDSGQVFPFSRHHKEMEMIAHDAEVLDTEAEFLFRPSYYIHEHSLDLVRVQDELLPIGPCDDMVHAVLDKDTRFSHN